MKLQDLRPAEGAHTPRTRVGRGITAGKGKTAGRGTKGQKARTGGTIQPWFEGGQTPIHIRVPKLRGCRNPFKTEFEVVNVGQIDALAGSGIFDPDEGQPENRGPITITPDILAAVGLVRSLDKPLKVLGEGEVGRALFVVADAFSKSATAKIEAAGGTAQVLEYPGAAGSDGRTGVSAALPATEASAAPAEPTAVEPESAGPESAEPAEPSVEAEKSSAKPARSKPAKSKGE